MIWTALELRKSTMRLIAQLYLLAQKLTAFKYDEVAKSGNTGWKARRGEETSLEEILFPVQKQRKKRGGKGEKKRKRKQRSEVKRIMQHKKQKKGKKDELREKK